YVTHKQPGAARSSQEQREAVQQAGQCPGGSPRAPLQLRVHPMKVSRRNHEESRSVAFCRVCCTSNSHDVSQLPSSLTNTQQQPADISDERQPFTSSTLTMTGWLSLQSETAYPTFPSHTQEPAKGPRGAAKTRGKEVQH
ncbi:hypothetical protein QJQ45_028839, partial [Haematococcus lacustris]